MNSSPARRLDDLKPARWQVRLLAVVVSIALLLCVDWTAGYLTYHLGDYHDSIMGVFRTNADPSHLRRQDPDYHHGLAAKRVTTETWGRLQYALVTNSLGFKDSTPRDVPLQSAGPRLMFIGDSFTEGMGFPYEQTWVGLVDKVLSARGIEVLNGGVSSYCPKTVYYKTKALLESGLRLSHIVFFIDVSDMDDEILFNGFVPANKDQDDAWTGRYVQTPYPPTLAQYSLTYRTFLRRQGRDPWRGKAIFTEPHTGESFIFDSRDRGTWPRGREPDWLQAAEGSATYYVKKLASLCAAHAIDFEIAIYPWPQDIQANDAHSRYRNIWQSFSAEQHIGCYDLHEAFFPADPALRQQILALDFIPHDVHWSTAGHQVVANEWLRQYRERHPN